MSSIPGSTVSSVSSRRLRGGGGEFPPPPPQKKKISNSPPPQKKTQQTTMLCSGVNGAINRPLPLNLKFPPKSRGLDETLTVSDVYPMFIEPICVPSGFSGYVWLDTEIVLKYTIRSFNAIDCIQTCPYRIPSGTQTWFHRYTMLFRLQQCSAPVVLRNYSAQQYISRQAAAV